MPLVCISFHLYVVKAIVLISLHLYVVKAIVLISLHLYVVNAIVVHQFTSVCGKCHCCASVYICMW